MTDLQRELDEIRAEIAVLEAELGELRQEAWADGKLDPAEEAGIEDTRTLLDAARDARQEIQLRIAQSAAPAGATGGDAPGADDQPAIVAVQAGIGGSVGQAGKNAPQDVATVQDLLNRNGASPALDVDGLCGPKTVGAIAAFQKTSLGFADGRVDVGGQTWAALVGVSSGAAAGGGGGAPAPAGPGGGTQPEAGPSGPVPVTILPPKEEQIPPAPTDDGGLPLFRETFVTAGPFAFKCQFDAKGNLVSCEAETNVGGLVLAIPLGLYTLSGGFQLLQVNTAVLNAEGPVVPVTMKVALKGFGAVEFGVEVFKATYELSLDGYTEARKILINREDPAATTSDVPEPTQVFVKGTGECKISGGKGVEVGAVIMKAEYDKLLIVTIHKGPSITVERGPGVDKFNDDVLAAIELAKKNPEMIGTGPTAGWSPGDPAEELEPGREELEADAMQQIADEAQRALVEKSEQTLRQRRAALEDPAVVGGANSMYQKDPAQAAKLYGALWQQRTDAIAAAAAYSPYHDGGPAAPEAKVIEAETLAGNCENVRQAFRAADAQWGYGQNTVWADEADDAAGGQTGGQTGQEDEGSIVDDVLDFFGLGDDDKKD